MTESLEEGNDPKRMGPPFPSRRDFHGSRIPKRPADAPGMEIPKNVPVKPVKAPPTETDIAIPEVVPAPEEPKATRAEKPLPKEPLPKETAPKSPPSKEESEKAAPKTVSAQPPVFVKPKTVSEASEQTERKIPAYPHEKRRSSHNKKKAKKKKSTSGVIVVVIFLLAVLGGGIWWAVASIPNVSGLGRTAAAEDYSGPGTGTVQIHIEPGETGYDIGRTLYDSGVVKSVEAFTAIFDSNVAAASIRPGTYTLRQGMASADALAMLLDDSNRSDNTVTVIPGQTVSQVKNNLVEVSSFSEEDIDAAVKDTAALGLPDVAQGDLEGWLFPGSYEIETESTASGLLSEMVKDTVDFLKSKDVPEDQWEKVLTEASIVEREVAWSDHMPQVARVVENRLLEPEAETRGKLQMDSTVLYGVGKSGGVPTASDMEDDNPYNTYLHEGLPPSPIASPSAAAIDAVLNPADGDWLYFVTVDLDSGETLFADTLAEQQANTEKFMKWCEENPGKC